MNRILPCAAAAILGAAVLAPTAWARNTPPGQGSSLHGTRAETGATITVLPASGLVARPVVDRNDRDAGRVNSLIIDVANGVVEYVLIEGRGGFDLNGQLVAIPWSMLVPPTLRDPIRLDVTRARLLKAPRIRSDVLYELTDRRWRSRIYGYFGSAYPWYGVAQPYGLYGPLGGGVTRPRNAAQADNWPATNAGPAAAGSRFAGGPPGWAARYGVASAGLLVSQNGTISALVMHRPAVTHSRPTATAVATSSQVFARNGTQIGHIDQLLIDPETGRVALVLLAKGGFLGVSPVVYSLPIQALRWSPWRDAYRLVVNEHLLNNVPAAPVNRVHLTTQVSKTQLARLYRHFGIAPYWTGQQQPTGEASGGAPRTSSNRSAER